MPTERIMRLETQMAHVERDLAAIRAKTDQIHEVVVEQRGFTKAMRTLGHVVVVLTGGLAGAISHKVLGG
jgi:hypothetical protein